MQGHTVGPRRSTATRCGVLGTLLISIGCFSEKAPTKRDDSASSVPQVMSSSSSAENDVPAWAGQRTDDPFDVQEFLSSRAAPPDNAAPLYLAALRPICRRLAGADVSPFEKEIGELANIEKLVADTVPPSRIDKVLTVASSALVRIDAAQMNPKCVFITGLTADVKMRTPWLCKPCAAVAPATEAIAADRRLSTNGSCDSARAP